MVLESHKVERLKINDSVLLSDIVVLLLASF